LLVCSARSARAEQAVGLEAQGVDVEAALDNGQGLDVRDAQGRPVSAELIRSQIKNTQAHAASDASYASALPQAKKVTLMLELLAGLATSIGRAAAELPWRWFADAALPRPGSKLPAVLILAFTLALALRSRARNVLAPVKLSSSLPKVLRC
jgi:hypothetical protein